MAEILQNLLSKADLLIVFVGMALLLWRALSSLSTLSHILAKGQTAAVPIPAPIPVHVPTAVPASPPAIPVPAAPPKPAGPFSSAPPWFQAALHEIGFHETGNNQGIERYIQMAHCGSLGDPWCAIFFNAMMESVGVPGTRSASSQSPRTDPGFVQLSGPALGAIVVYWRISKPSGQGHVGFYRGEDATRVWTLGGNENDMVQIEALPKDSASFGLIGYWWPKSVPLPTVGAVLMPTGSPVSVQTPPAGIAPTAAAPAGKQSSITATVFGGQQSAYGGPIIDTQPGVALPFRFTGERPRVRVTGKTSGQSIDCDIVDVGPWNINDPYWTTGARPQAETGTDMGQTSTPRHTNGAGIDLTAAAAKAIGIDGKGLCDWSFIEASPNVT